MLALWEEMNARLQNILEVSAKPKIRRLIDVHNFGAALTEHEENFRWPTYDDLSDLDLDEPLVLKEIRTDGIQGNAMTAIQLVF